MIILDTNVISELVRHEPSSAVLKKVRSFPSGDLYTTVITEAEIRLGLAILPRGKKRTALQMQVDLILKEDLAGRILPFDSEAAQAYAKLVAARRIAGDRCRCSMPRLRQSSKPAEPFLLHGIRAISRVANLM